MGFWKKLFGGNESPKAHIAENESTPPPTPVDANAKKAEIKPAANIKSAALHEAVTQKHVLAEVKKAMGVSANPRSDSAVNLERWKSTAEAEAWVRKHLQGWNHNDWLELLASLRKSQNWPMDEAAIGQHLEMLRAKLRTTEVKESPTREESAPFIEAIRKGEGHTDAVFAVAVTRDGQRAVSGSHDKTLKVWDLDSGCVLQTLEGHAGLVSAVAVMPDGQRAVSGSYDHTLKVWDLESGCVLQTLEGHATLKEDMKMTALTLAVRAHDFQESEDWGGAAQCYEEILDNPLSALDRAKTLANLMQMYDKLGHKQKALNAGLGAMELIEASVSEESSEVLHLRGYVRGYVYRLQG